MLDANASIHHPQLRQLLALAECNRHLTAVRRELDGIGEQVPDHLLQPIGIARDRCHVWVKVKRDLNLFRVCLPLSSHGFYSLVHAPLRNAPLPGWKCNWGLSVRLSFGLSESQTENWVSG